MPSSPVVPLDDPTLLFTNAGMNQFKDVFLGSGSRSYARATDTQKCIRAGGKHNDLDDVGIDTYHHTFFEMLGNWSFGDYFKKEAIEWAWELLTHVWGIDKTRLHATYFEGKPEAGLEPDNETRDLWATVTDIDRDNIHPGDMKDNFWEMGDTGPCGPCSEIHIDLTPHKSGGDLVNAGDHRVIEIWNLVFIQFNRAADGKLTSLPAKHVDTGMGFERLCAVLAGKDSNYDTDIWAPIFTAIQKRTGSPDYRRTLPMDEARGKRQEARGRVGGTSRSEVEPTIGDADSLQAMIDVSYRIIADHLRCLTFALTDGAVPSNEGRGYVLRRILRRAVRYGRQYLDTHEPFLCDLVHPLVEHMAEAFPELRTAHGGKNVEHVVELIRDEEESFGRTLDRGIKLFDEAAEEAIKRHHGEISGQDAFKLHDTYGFPIDLTELMAAEHGLKVNIGEYERLMEEARRRARSAGKEVLDDLCGAVSSEFLDAAGKCDDSPKCDESFQCQAVVTACAHFGARPPQPGAYMALSTDRTCFYIEQGGQVCDSGTARTETGEVRIETVRRAGECIIHYGTIIHGDVSPGQKCELKVAPTRRSTMQNHTATHLLNWALREVLGPAVQQKGSLVDHEKTRFDFSYNKPLTVKELTRIETLVNQQIEAEHAVYTREVEQAKAREINTLRAVFGEKYPDSVRVVSVGADIDEMLEHPNDEKWMGYAVELCGGTHPKNTADVERFAIVSEEAVAKGIRRVVGVTAGTAKEAEATGETLMNCAKAFSGEPAGELDAKLAVLQRDLSNATIPARVRHALRECIAELQQTVKQQQKQQAAVSGEAVMERMATLLESAETIDGVTIVVGEVPAAQPDALRGAIDWVRNKTDASAVLLATRGVGKVTLIAGMSKAVVKRGLKAGDLIREMAPVVGGKGGGRADMAQGGGTNPKKTAEVVEAAREWIAEKLS